MNWSPSRAATARRSAAVAACKDAPMPINVPWLGDGWVYYTNEERETLMHYRSARSRKATEPLGFVLHRGVSPGTGDPYVVIATLHSENEKTGDVVTVWIVRDDVSPVVAKQRGQEHATCLGCILGMHGGCYVVVQNAPNQVWRAYKGGRYPEYDARLHERFIKHRVVRWGGYGEPVLIPMSIIARWAAITRGWVGYTQQWRNPAFAEYRPYLMASVMTPRQADFAQSLGWRTFRITFDLEADGVRRREFLCPASYEGGERMQCDECLACDGADRPVGAAQRASVVVKFHANGAQSAMLSKALRLGVVSLDE